MNQTFVQLNSGSYIYVTKEEFNIFSGINLDSRNLKLGNYKITNITNKSPNFKDIEYKLTHTEYSNSIGLARLLEIIEEIRPAVIIPKQTISPETRKQRRLLKKKQEKKGQVKRRAGCLR